MDTNLVKGKKMPDQKLINLSSVGDPSKCNPKKAFFFR